jgi:hypothetical protein
MAGKLDGSAIVSGSISSTQLDNSLNTSISQGGGPKITQIQITDSSYTVLDDTAVSLTGGYIKITGTGFASGAEVIIGTTNATSITFVNSTTLNVQVPALSAGTYTIYVVNTDGGTAIGVNGLTYSSEPTWVTGSALSGQSGAAISFQLDATDATTYTLQAGSSLPAGLTLTSGGLLSGTVTVGVETVYSFTIDATDAQSQDSPRTFNVTITVSDPYFNLTTLLLPGNGTNNGNNNTFTDSSTNNYTVTRYGNATQGTFSPFSINGWSNFFDGAGDSLTFTGSSATSFTGDLTLEAWVFLRSFAGSSYNECCILSLRSGLSTGTQFDFGRAGGALGAGNIAWWTNGSIVAQGIAGDVPLNQWVHVAFVRNGSGSNNCKIYVDGVQKAQGTNTATMGVSSGTCYIGNSAYDQPIDGYMSNFRLTNTAVYTSAFTPPTSSLTAIAGTALLTCQNNRFIDNSTNNFTITKNNDVRVQPFSPFAPSGAYSAATNGGSTYYDGTGDYLGTVNTPANVTNNNFTAESWVWFNSSGVGYQPIFMNTGTGDYQGWVLIVETNNTITGIASTNGSSWTNVLSTSVTPVTGCWTHFAMVRNGSTLTLYVNGISRATSNISTASIHSPSGAFYVGYYPFFPGGARSFNGYFSGTRIVNGTAVYTSNFTPPTAPPTAVANTSLLLNYTNGQIIDATTKNNLETVSDAKISTSQNKWGGSSMSFARSPSSYLVANNSSRLLSLGTANFTVEAWIYMNTLPAGNGYPNSYWLIGGGLVNSDTGFDIAIGSTNLQIALTSFASLNINTAHNMSATTWYHIAVTRSGSTLYAFINGVQLTTASVSSVTVDPCLTGLAVAAAEPTGATAGNFNGYINDLRITRGYARYTSNFTPPSSAFQTQ